MNILVVAATEAELAPAQRAFESELHLMSSRPSVFRKPHVSYLVTGVGAFRMAYALGESLATDLPDLTVCAGIAGAYPGKLHIGDVVEVNRDMFYDLGAENSDGSFLSIEDMHLIEDISSINGLINKSQFAEYKLYKAFGVTVNLVHGTENSIRKAITRYDPDIETMENAAFFYACLKHQIPFLSVRAISNIVEPRNRNNWNIELALQNLEEKLRSVFKAVLE